MGSHSCYRILLSITDDPSQAEIFLLVYSALASFLFIKMAQKMQEDLWIIAQTINFVSHAYYVFRPNNLNIPLFNRQLGISLDILAYFLYTPGLLGLKLYALFIFAVLRISRQSLEMFELTAEDTILFTPLDQVWNLYF